VEIERLKTFERKRVLGIVKEKSVLSAAGPAVKAFFNSPMMLLKFEIVRWLGSST